MLEQLITDHAMQAAGKLFGVTPQPEQITVQRTAVPFRADGDFSLVVFPLLKISRKSPEETARLLGEELMQSIEGLDRFSVMKGYLNLKFKHGVWTDFLNRANRDDRFGYKPIDENSKPVVVEYSSPNTNKPLHLGHIRNNLLGYSVARILEANGTRVAKVNLVNDRGIHICKSMLAWQRYGEGATPETAGMKGDKLVGEYYVRFDQENKKQVQQLRESGAGEEEAANTALMDEARDMLRKWEARDPETIDCWQTMNRWVYNGFDETYRRMGVDFDKIYYESDTYLLGKNIVDEGLERGVFFRKPDGSVWVDLTDEGLDEKLLLRADGTSVYMTQDLGTAQLRADDYDPQALIYVVGNEQNYHFDVLKKTLLKLGRSWAAGLYHLSYGMVELPEGKMKSREGTVVDADDLMDEMIATARAMTVELGKIEDFDSQEAEELYKTVGLGALKYFILKVDPRKTMLFNPKESIDFNGNTGPFIQYTYARIRSVLRKAGDLQEQPVVLDVMHEKERSLLVTLYQFGSVVEEAARQYSPALVANYLYDVAREYNQFYHELTILKEENPSVRHFRLMISQLTATVIKNGSSLLGMAVPERM